MENPKSGLVGMLHCKLEKQRRKHRELHKRFLTKCKELEDLRRSIRK